MREGPTSNILKMAGRRPGGVVRWHEVRDAYLAKSSSARYEHRMGMHQHHMSIARVLHRHFTRVGNTRGFYVLNSQTVGLD